MEYSNGLGFHKPSRGPEKNAESPQELSQLFHLLAQGDPAHANGINVRIKTKVLIRGKTNNFHYIFDRLARAINPITAKEKSHPAVAAGTTLALLMYESAAPAAPLISTNKKIDLMISVERIIPSLKED